MGARTRPIVIALDGPAGAGKSTVAQRIARAFGYTLLDTGAIYRTVALAAERANVAWTDEAGLSRLTQSLVSEKRIVLEPTEGSGMRVRLDGAPLGQEIRTPSISMGASTVSAIAGVRTALLSLQRDFAKGVQGLVAEGRDIGTVIFPDAEVKLFLTATVEERAKRRHAEFLLREPEITFERTLEAVISRDRQDETRAVAPLRKADDAVIVDSTGITPDQTADRALAIVREKLETLAKSEAR
jgi:cytidylate kinase